MGIQLGANLPDSIRLGASEIDAAYLGSTQVWPVGVPPVDWQLLGLAIDANGQFQSKVDGDGAVTFARSTIATFTDFEGLVKTALVDELRVRGLRRVENIVLSEADNPLNSSDDLTGSHANNVTLSYDSLDGFSEATLVGTGAAYCRFYKASSLFGLVAAGTYVASCEFRGQGSSIGRVAGIVVATGEENSLTLTGDWQRLKSTVTFAVDTNMSIQIDLNLINGTVQTGEVVEIRNCMIERVSGQANQNPAEYVSAGILTEFPNNVDGVAYFDYLNGNTVDGNGIVTEQKGAQITGEWGSLWEPAATNSIRYNSNLTNTAWSKRGSVSVSIDTNVDGPRGTPGMSLIENLGAFAVSDTYQIVNGVGSSTDPIAIGFYIRKGLATGTLVARNASSDASGRWNIDLSLVGDDVERITSDHPAVTVVNPFIVHTNGGSGLLFFMTSGSVDIHVSDIDHHVGAAVISSTIYTAGASVNRTADDGAGMYDYSNWNNPAGAVVMDVSASTFDFATNLSHINVTESSTNGPQRQLTTSANNLRMSSPGGTTQMGFSAKVDNDFYRCASMFEVGQTQDLGYNHIDGVPGWNWSAGIVTYAEFLTSSTINLAYSLQIPVLFKNLYIYDEYRNQAYIEANH